MGGFFDDLETRDGEAREADLMAALARQIAHAKETAPAFASSLEAVDPAAITDREALARLPVIRKSDLTEAQRAAPPFGGLAGLPSGEIARILVSPGPIYEFASPRQNFWRLARALYAAGFRTGDVVHNAFSYHLSPGGWMLDDGARALGCCVIPAGIGNTEQQAEAIAHLRPNGFTGTPDFLKVLLDKGAELSLDLTSITKALVSGGALFPSLREEYAERGVAVLQCYATADLGLIAYESEAREGLVIDEEIIVEILRPGTGDPLPPGEVGEVVVTTLTPEYPLIRFATGDLSAILPGASPCGRTNARLKGWMGRADQATKVKGLFVHPSQVAEVIKRHREIVKARLVITRSEASDVMSLRCEGAGPSGKGLESAVADSLQAVCKLRGEVVFVPPDDLPNDGKVIDDQRDYDGAN